MYDKYFLPYFSPNKTILSTQFRRTNILFYDIMLTIKKLSVVNEKMTQEEKLDLILSEMTTIKTDLKDVKTELQSMKIQQDEHSKALHTLTTELSDVKSDLQSVKTELQSVKTQQDEHSKVLHALTTDLSGVKADLQNVKTQQNEHSKALHALTADLSGVKTQLEEHGQILQAVLHNQEVANAEIEGIKLTMATSESVRTLDIKFDLLNTRLFHQETEIVKLKCVK